MSIHKRSRLVLYLMLVLLLFSVAACGGGSRLRRPNQSNSTPALMATPDSNNQTDQLGQEIEGMLQQLGNQNDNADDLGDLTDLDN